MRQSFRELDLGPLAVSWAEERLRSTSYLANEAYENFRSSDGHVVVSWPRDLDVKLAYDFEAGGKFGRSGKSEFAPLSWLATELRHYLSRSNSHVILQQLYVEADLLIPAGPLEPYRCRDNYAYFTCSSADDVDNFLQSFSLSGIGQHFLVAVVVGPLRKEPSNIIAAFLPIYDGEGFIRLTFKMRAAANDLSNTSARRPGTENS